MTAKINILGAEYQLLYEKMGKSTYGSCNGSKKVIKINSKLDHFAENLVHEVIHGVFWESGLHHVLTVDGHEEAIVRAIEHGLKSAGLIPEVTIDDFMDTDSVGESSSNDGVGGD